MNSILLTKNINKYILPNQKINAKELHYAPKTDILAQAKAKFANNKERVELPPMLATYKVKKNIFDKIINFLGL